MKKLFPQAVIFALVLLVFSSCSSKLAEETKLIPKDASMVAVFDPGLMQAKLEKGNISIDSVFAKIFQSVNDSEHTDLKQKFNDLRTNSGIDWSNKLFFFAEQKNYPNNGHGSTINIIAHLKDSALFFQYLRKQEDIKGRDVVKDKNFTYIQLDYKGMISWTDKLVMATIFNYSEMPVKDSLLHAYQVEGINKTEEIKKEVTRYYTLKEDESLASVKPFTDLFKQKSDAYFYNSSSAFISGLSMMPIQLPKLQDLLADNFSVSTFNFDDGKITGNSATYTNKALSAILKKYTGSTINMQMIETYPSDNIDMAFLTSFNPEMIDAIIKEIDIEALADMFTQKMDVKTGDLYKCLKGDLAVIVSDFAWKKTKENSMFKSMPSVKCIINASVGDTGIYHKLMNNALQNELVVKQNNTYTSGKLLKTFGIVLNADDKNFMLATDSALYQKYISKTGKAGISKEVLDQLKGKSAAGFIDLDKLFGGMIQASDTSANEFGKTMQHTFKDIIASSENFDGTKIQAHSELRMKDEKENSLVTLLKVFMKIAPTLKRSGATDDIKTLPFIKNIIAVPMVKI
jgi:hypothetical protein